LRKRIGLLFLLVVLIGCSPKVNLIDSTNQPLPKPSYQVSDLAGRFKTNFYYAEVFTFKDLDGSSLLRSENFIPVYTKHKLKDKTEYVNAVIQIHNPKRIPYQIIETSKIIRQEGSKEIREEKTGVSVAKSDLEYRSYTFKLPAKSIKSAECEFIIISEGEHVFTFGKLEYYSQW
jgi:hypothetical protein